ncbi:MAG: hypothetical protein FWF55_08500 [Treponema sp.]|nr:hypothetical protein [Treponema sp.]
MENYFYEKLNENTVEAVRRNAAFFMNPPDSRIPVIMDSYRGQPITGANYFNLQLSNDLSGKGHTEYVKMSETLSVNRDWLSSLPRESRPRGTLYREESADSNAGYSFVMPTAELNQNIYHDNRDTPAHHYVPYQSSGASMSGNFNDFVHEQFANAINASLTGCPFRNNIRPHEVEQFKARLLSEISRNPAFMAVMADRARDEAFNYHYIPLDRNKFVERARDENSPEFSRLNYAINAHVHDMHHNRKESFNPDFNELARPLVIKIDKLYLCNTPRHVVDGEIAGFVKTMIRQPQPAKILADTYAGTFVEKAIKLARTAGKGIFAGVIIAGALVGSQYAFPAGAGIAGAVIAGSIEPIMNFCKIAARKMGGDASHSRLDDMVKVAAHIMSSQEMKGDRSLKNHCDHNNPRSFYTHLNKTIRDNPRALDQAIAHINNRQPERTQSMTRGQAMRR